MSAIEMVPRHALSFKEFVRLSEHQRKGLGQVTIVPPQLGEPGFGYVVAEKPTFIQRATQGLKLPKLRRKR